MSHYSRLENVEALAARRVAVETGEALAEFKAWRVATWTSAELEALERVIIHLPMEADRRARVFALAGVSERDAADILAATPEPTPAELAMVTAALARATPAQRARWGWNSQGS